MSTKYLLPCLCGRKIAIEVGQSGQTVSCTCGRRLDVPTMLQIRALERIEEECPPRVRLPWGVRQGLVLIGTLIVVASVCIATGLYLARPRLPTPPQLEQVQAYMEKLSLLQSQWEWQHLRGGLDEAGAREIEAAFGAKRASYHRWLAVAGVIGVLGVICAASSLLVPQGKPDGHTPDG